MLDHYENNNLCEICYENQEPNDSNCTFDICWINTHCIELRRNRESRKNKNAKPTYTEF